MRKTGKKKYIRKANRNGIGWQKMIQGWRDVRSVQDPECEVAVQAENWFNWVVGG